jgi:hypothetical protein
MSSVVSMEAVLKSLECLPAEQKVAILSSLLLQAKPVSVAKAEEVAKPAEEGAKKAKKEKKEKDPDAPKKEGSWWAKASAEVSAQMKPLELLKKEDKMTIPSFCGLLKDKGFITKEGRRPTEEELRAVVAEIRADPEAVKKAAAEKKEAKKATKPAKKEEAVAQKEAVEEGFFVFEGKKYRVAEGTPEEGCFLFDGEECVGFFFNGELDREVKME